MPTAQVSPGPLSERGREAIAGICEHGPEAHAGCDQWSISARAIVGFVRGERRFGHAGTLETA